MKDFVCRIQSLLLFDFPSRNNQIRESFLSIHTSNQQQFPHWPLLATRQKVVSRFWYQEVVLHFGTILLTASLLVLPFHDQWRFAFPAILIAAVTSFPVLFLATYKQIFVSDFLPMLENIVAEQERFVFSESETKKCKRTQFSIPTLTIIFYVFTKTSNSLLPAANDRSAELLNNLFGADKDKLKQNLSRLYKISTLSPKERAEMLKGVEASRTFFEALDFSKAQNVLDNLELKLQKTG